MGQGPDVTEVLNPRTRMLLEAPIAPTVLRLAALNVLSIGARLAGAGGAGAIGGFSSTTEYECRVQPEPFEKALLTHQLTVAQMFGEKMKTPSQ